MDRYIDGKQLRTSKQAPQDSGIVSTPMLQDC